MKKIVSVLLALLLSVNCFSLFGFAEEADTSEHITEVPEGYVGIYTKDDLDNIKINFSGKYILMNDIVFEEADYQEGGSFYNDGKGWEPIATSYSSSSFSGTFDGNGYSISNLYINDSSVDYKGLFGKAENATIKNVTLKAVDITGSSYVGGICGKMVRSTILGCIVSGNTSGASYVGGICGKMGYSDISGCVVSGNISGTNCIGGVCGSSEGESTISYSSVAGGVSGSNLVGGICGSQGPSSFNNIKNRIDYCCNSSSVSADSNGCAGGISGQVSALITINGGSYSYISNSTNCGSVVGSVAGGMVGTGFCGTHDKNTSSIYNCVNVGAVSGSSKSGGICADDEYISPVSKCYYLGAAITNSTCTKGISKSKDQLKKRSTFEDWDFDTVWTMEGRPDYPYPELQNVPLILPEDLMHKHEYTAVVTTEPTHLTEGVKTYTCACGDSYTEVISKTAEHTYVSEVTAEPTHLTEGVMTYTCACGDSYTEAIPKTAEHTYISEVTTEPTHLTEGVMTYTCACGDSYTEAIPKTAEHTYVTVVIAPTCTEKGYTAYNCACGASYTSNYVDALGHDIIKDPAAFATCTESGLTEGEHCSRCNYRVAQKNIPALGHEMSDFVVVKNSTCTENGVERSNCSRCDYFEVKKLPLAEHSDKNGDGRCDDCNGKIEGGVSCNCICHGHGIKTLIYKILLLIQRITQINLVEKVTNLGRICKCGAVHY